jgi:hypothetical protein
VAKPAPYDITIRRGDDFELFFKVRQPNGGAYVDITGWTGRAQMRETKAQSGSPTVTFTVTILDQNISLGGVTVTLSDTLSAAIVPNAGVYDVELTNLSGEVRTFIEGTVTVDQDVTR